MRNLEQESQPKEIQKTLPGLKIWKHSVESCIFQGWMGVWVSTAELAWAVAHNEWVWILSAGAIHTIPKYREYRVNLIEEAKKAAGGKLSKEESRRLFIKANVHCIKEEIKQAKEIAQWNGKIFINIMVASKDYDDCVRAACEAGVDGIVSGAGVPYHLPKLTSEYPDVALVPILSRLKWVDILMRRWDKPYEVELEIGEDRITTINGQKIKNRKWELFQEDWIKISPVINGGTSVIRVGDREYNYSIGKEKENNVVLKKIYPWKKPDAIVIESTDTWWWHLWAIGGKLSEVYNPETSLEVAIPATVQYLKQEWLDIPVIAAWWIVTRQDIDKRLEEWAGWTQIWSLFLIAEESNAHPAFKNDVINAKPKDVDIYNSSALYPARYLKKSLKGEDIKGIVAKWRACVAKCLNNCAERDGIPWYAQICIKEKLGQSVKWSSGKGLKFIWRPFDENWNNKIARLIPEKSIRWTSRIVFPTVKEIMGILNKYEYWIMEILSNNKTETEIAAA